MSSSGSAPKGDPRARAARTKRNRSRAALIDAADAVFAARGWAATRVEDIARTAGVSPATAYNHFPSKHVLIASVFAPHVRTLLAQVDAHLASARPVTEALSEQVMALALLSARNRRLMAAFTAAVLEYTIRSGTAPRPGDELDPRNVADLPEALRALVERGQATGELRPYPPAYEIAVAVVNLLMLRSINRVDEPPEVTAELLLTLLFGALRPESVTGARPFRRGR